MAYLAARELVYRRPIALLAAAFVALNPYLVWYSQEARSYALMVLFATVAFSSSRGLSTARIHTRSRCGLGFPLWLSRRTTSLFS